MTKYTNKQLKEICRLQRIFNDYGFANGQAYITHISGNNGRVSHYPYWRVVKAGAHLSDRWGETEQYDISIVGRLDKVRRLQEAMDFAKKKFGIADWARGPFGAYYDKAFVEKRTTEVLVRHEASLANLHKPTE